MKGFAALLELLSVQTEDAARLALLTQYLRDTPDPDRGWALAVLTGAVELRLTTPAMLRRLAGERIDPRLFELSQEFVGELAETVALIWPEPARPSPVGLSELVAALLPLDRKRAPGVLAQWLDRLPVSERWALLRLAGGRTATLISGTLAREAVAGLAGRPLAEVERIWHGVAPPYAALFAWAEGRARAPAPAAHGFRPLMQAIPATSALLRERSVDDYRAEWRWCGERVLLAVGPDGRALYSAAGDDISDRAPDLLAGLPADGVVLDGVLRPGGPLLLVDLLSQAGEDLTALPFTSRRARLEAWAAARMSDRMALSPLLPIVGWKAAEALRAAPVPGASGLILKRSDSRYAAVGDGGGAWLSWRREAATVVAAVMYARAEGGGRTGLFSDLTVGLWQDGALVPVGRVSAGEDDALRADLDAWVRAHTSTRHGPVREVAPTRVLRIAFDAVAASRRHKAGLVLKRARIVDSDSGLLPAEPDKLSVLSDLLAKSAERT